MKFVGHDFLDKKEIGKWKLSIQYTLRDWKNLKVRLMLENDKLSNFGSRNQGKRFSYRSIIESLLFSASIKNDTKTIFITCNGLNDAKTTIIHEQNYKHMES